MAFISIILAGLTIGFIGGMSGIAGAPFLIAYLTIFMDFSQHGAQGTILAMMLGPMSILTVIHSWDIIVEKWKNITICIVSYMVLSYFGAVVAYLFDSKTLQILFGVFIVFFGIIYASLVIENKIKTMSVFNFQLNIINTIVVGSFVGFVGGMFGIGAGILLVPIFTTFFSVSQNEARVISLAILTPPVSIGAVFRYQVAGGFLDGNLLGNFYSFFETGDIDWSVAAILLFFYIVSNGFGTKFGNLRKPATLKQILGILLIIMGLLNIFR